MRSVFKFAIFIAGTTVFAAEMPGQLPERISPRTASESVRLQAIVHPIVRASGQIFSGTVLKIEHCNSDSSSTLATTRVFFRVDEPIRNVRRGQVVEVNEWAGLWQLGERYRPGERVLLFLYPPSKLGLTSPVRNHAGRFPVDPAGGVQLGNPANARQPIEIRRVVAAIRQAEKE